LLEVSEVNAQQIVNRAGRRLESGRRRAVDVVEHLHLVETFTFAARFGDVAPLESVLLRAVAAPVLASS
jgi:RNA polymerase sigma-70 factor (ECF subfamily)